MYTCSGRVTLNIIVFADHGKSLYLVTRRSRHFNAPRYEDDSFLRHWLLATASVSIAIASSHTHYLKAENLV